MASFDLSCDWKAGFTMDPLNKQRVGYLTALNCIDLAEGLEADITAFTPFSADPDADGDNTYSGLADVLDENKVQVVGMIESFSFGGGVGDALCISAYLSMGNANMLSGKMKDGVKTTKVPSLGWWIVNFDAENKAWYEESFPLNANAITGQINESGGGVALQVSPEPTKIAANLDVQVVQVYFEVIPAANKVYHFHFAESLKTKVVRNWGLVVGESAEQALPDENG